MKYACLAGLLVGGVVLGCSDSDTIVALNVCTLGSVDAEAVEELHVTLSLPGGATASRDLHDVAVLPCGTKPSFYERIELSPDVAKGRATVLVEAHDGAGNLLDEASISITVRPQEAVAAFVELGEEPMEGSGGTGGMTGSAGEAGAAGAAGQTGSGANAGAGGAGE